MFAHAMGHNVFRGTAGAAEGAEGEWKEGGETAPEESGGHMSPLLLLGALDTAGFSC